MDQSIGPAGEKKEGFFAELIRFVFIVLVIVLPIRFFVAQPFIVSGASMDPTFSDGEYLIVDELSYHFRVPTRGEVVIFRFPRDPAKFYIKRVIGLPGETIIIENGRVRVKSSFYPEGLLLAEPYLGSLVPAGLRLEETLGEDEYFVMGDNRQASSDSRSWGPVREDLVIGRAFVRLFPISEIGVLPGNYSN